MKIRSLRIAGVFAAALTCAAGPVAAQTQTKAQTGKAYAVPKTADGQPDLQGVWANNAATPLERPRALAGKTVLSEEELIALKATAEELFNGSTDAAFGDSVFEAALAKAKGFKSRDTGTGNYNHFWLVERNFDSRTSLVTDPPDGRIPALTEDGQRRSLARRGTRQAEGGIRAEGGGRGYDSWEDRGMSERCITFGVPRLGAGYNSYYQIVQSPGYVAIMQETIHDVRLIPLDGRPHVGQNVRQLLGDSRGHWEGNTLVVETTNYSPASEFQGAAENLHIVERFTRAASDVLKYEVTATDPSTWVKPWSAMINLSGSKDQVFEFACHEGNLGMYGILHGARELEKRAAEAAKKGSN